MKMKPLLEVADEIMTDINEAKNMTDEDIKVWRDPSIQQGILLAQPENRDKEFKLCLVLDNQAWFTTQDVTKQWGDDWDDAPYEHNAGPPYEDMDCAPYEIKKVYWESDKFMNRDNGINSDFSVNQINSGRFGWISYCCDKYIHEIHAGTTLEEFKKLVDVYERV